MIWLIWDLDMWFVNIVLDGFRISVVRALNIVNEFHQRSKFESWPKLEDEKISNITCVD